MKPLNELWNVFPHSPLTAYSRFLRGPDGGIKTTFSEARAEWDGLRRATLNPLRDITQLAEGNEDD